MLDNVTATECMIHAVSEARDSMLVLKKNAVF